MNCYTQGMEGKIKAIIFDNDGVLNHTERTFFEVNKRIFESLGIQYDENDFIEHTFNTGLGSTGRMESRDYTKEVIDEFTTKRDVAYKEEIKKINTLKPETKSILPILKRNYKLCITTNTRRDMFQFSDNEVYQLFDEVVYREDYKNTKPAPDAYIATLKKVKLYADEVMVIEDSPRGVESAKRAGIKVIAVTNPHFPHLDTSKADYHVTSLTQLPDLMKNL